MGKKVSKSDLFINRPTLQTTIVNCSGCATILLNARLFANVQKLTIIGLRRVFYQKWRVMFVFRIVCYIDNQVLAQRYHRCC